MACNGLGVVLDTNVFVCWCDNELGYGGIVDAIVDENLYIVICYSLEKEYLHQLNQRFVGAGGPVLKRKIDQFYLWGILRYVVSNPREDVQIHRKDQHVLDCALNDEYLVHFIITENQDHFESTATELPLPIMMNKDYFLNPDSRHNACSDAKRILHNIKLRGTKKGMLG